MISQMVTPVKRLVTPINAFSCIIPDVTVVKSRILQRDMLMQVNEEVQMQLSAKDGEAIIDLAGKLSDMKQVEQSIGRLLAAIRDAGHSRTMLDELARLEAKQAELQQQLTILSTDGKVNGNKLTISVDDIIAYIQNDLASDDRIKLAQVLRHLIVKVTIIKNYKLSGEIVYTMPFPGAGNYTVSI